MVNRSHELLLDAHNIIDKERKKEERNPEFNLIPLLREIHDEVHLHSQIFF